MRSLFVQVGQPTCEPSAQGLGDVVGRTPGGLRPSIAWYFAAILIRDPALAVLHLYDYEGGPASINMHREGLGVTAPKCDGNRVVPIFLIDTRGIAIAIRHQIDRL